MQSEPVQISTDRGTSKPKLQTLTKGSEKSKKAGMASIRVKKETKKSLESTLSKLNQKDYGRKIRADELLTLALSLVTPQHLAQLQEGALTHTDRLERDYREYLVKNGQISRDEYLGKRLSGEIAPPQLSRAPQHL